MSNLYILDVTCTTVERVQVVADSVEEAMLKVTEMGGIEDSELISSSVDNIVYVDEDRWDWGE